jgi:DASH complex subunit Duo1
MAISGVSEEMERLEIADEDTQGLWNSPSRKRDNSPSRHGKESSDSPEQMRSRNGETLFDREEAREAALRQELQTVRNINQAIEGVLESLTRARGNMEVRYALRDCACRALAMNDRLTPT